mmetsp:Transcript_19019/g.31554  ORF Transcript_19019/g.31554 Transcript_19019/m.31554 type:complete len:139 (+) Transcript_19019:173-589(+)
MKISTRHTNPLNSPSCMVNPNQSIPRNAGAITTPSKNGRQIKFEPTVVFTPVMTSNRTKRSSPEKPRLSQTQVDDVCTLLSSLFIDDEATNNEETKDETADAVEYEALGRFDETVASRKSANKMVTVRRSARLVACKN